MYILYQKTYYQKNHANPLHITILYFTTPILAKKVISKPRTKCTTPPVHIFLINTNCEQYPLEVVDCSFVLGAQGNRVEVKFP